MDASSDTRLTTALRELIAVAHLMGAASSIGDNTVPARTLRDGVVYQENVRLHRPVCGLRARGTGNQLPNDTQRHQSNDIAHVCSVGEFSVHADENGHSERANLFNRSIYRAMPKCRSHVPESGKTRSSAKRPPYPYAWRTRLLVWIADRR